MQGYNCIMIYNKKKDELLFCTRSSEPYQGLYNFVGGKIEPEEGGFSSAYRKLEEETGITREHI